MFILPRIKEDKANHFAYGFIIFVICNCFLNEWYSLAVVTVIALLTELWDEYKWKSGDLRDAFWTVLPAVLLTAKQYIINN